MYVKKEQAQEIRNGLDNIVKAQESGLDSLWMWLETNKDANGFYLFRENTVMDHSEILRSAVEKQGDIEKIARELVARWFYSGESGSSQGLELLIARIAGVLNMITQNLINQFSSNKSIQRGGKRRMTSEQTKTR